MILQLVTGYIQSLYYTLITRAGSPKPSPRSPRFLRDRKRIHVLVILAYLAYTIYEADHALRKAGDFYSALGVPHDVDENGLNRRFRRLTVQYHPDKISADSPIPKEQIEATYVHLKLARDTLIDPAKRFAYDRFGAEVLSWPLCKTTRDYILRGVQQTIVYYVASGVGLVLVGILGYLQEGKFWRYVVMTAFFVAELAVITRPVFPGWLTGVVNPLLSTTGAREPYLPFQILVLGRKLAVTFFIALAQLGPLLKDDGAVSSAAMGEGEGVPQQLVNQMEALARTADQEITRLMGLELSPFLGERSGVRELREAVKEWLVQNTVRNDAEVKTAVNTVLNKRREEGALPQTI